MRVLACIPIYRSLGLLFYHTPNLIDEISVYKHHLKNIDKKKNKYLFDNYFTFFLEKRKFGFV